MNNTVIRRNRNRLFLIITLSASLAGSCAPTIQDVGRREGCEAAEERLAYFAEREIRIRRFKDDIKLRLTLAPLSFGLGIISNYLLQATFIIPALAPGGYSMRGDEISAIGLKKALAYTRLRGSRLDAVDDKAIAKMTFEVAMCYYENENWNQASTYLEGLRGSKYELYIGEENILYCLGRCYYMLGLYDSSIESYRNFLKVAPILDFRRGQVNRSIRTIETLSKKGLWGLERPESAEPPESSAPPESPDSTEPEQ